MTELTQRLRSVPSPALIAGLRCAQAVPLNEPSEKPIEQEEHPKRGERQTPPTNMFWGDRYGWIRDPFGHMWALCTIQEVLTPDQVEARMRRFSAQMKGQES